MEHAWQKLAQKHARQQHTHRHACTECYRQWNWAGQSTTRSWAHEELNGVLSQGGRCFGGRRHGWQVHGIHLRAAATGHRDNSTQVTIWSKAHIKKMHHGTEKLKDTVVWRPEAHRNGRKRCPSAVGARKDDAPSPPLLQDRGGNQLHGEKYSEQAEQNYPGRILLAMPGQLGRSWVTGGHGWGEKEVGTAGRA